MERRKGNVSLKPQLFPELKIYSQDIVHILKFQCDHSDRVFKRSSSMAHVTEWSHEHRYVETDCSSSLHLKSLDFGVGKICGPQACAINQDSSSYPWFKGKP